MSSLLKIDIILIYFKLQDPLMQPDVFLLTVVIFGVSIALIIIQRFSLAL